MDHPDRQQYAYRDYCLYKCRILNLQSVCDNHTEFEYVLLEVLLVYSIVLEQGTVVVYGLWRIRQDAGYLGTFSDA